MENIFIALFLIFLTSTIAVYKRPLQFLKNKTEPEIKKTKIGLIVLTIVFFVLFGVSSDASKQNKVQNSQATAPPATTTQKTPTPTPTPQPPQTIEEKIKAQLGTNDTFSIEDDVDLDTSKVVPGKKWVNITLTLGDAFWDINAAKSGVWRQAAKLTENIFPLDDAIGTLQIKADIPTKDAYGKEAMSQLELITITRKTYAKIKWDSFDYKNIPVIADTYYENKSIK